MDRGEIHRCKILTLADIENGVSIPVLLRNIDQAVRIENFEAAAGIKQAIEEYQENVKKQMGE